MSWFHTRTLTSRHGFGSLHKINYARHACGGSFGMSYLARIEMSCFGHRWQAGRFRSEPTLLPNAASRCLTSFGETKGRNKTPAALRRSFCADCAQRQAEAFTPVLRANMDTLSVRTRALSTAVRSAHRSHLSRIGVALPTFTTRVRMTVNGAFQQPARNLTGKRTNI